MHEPQVLGLHPLGELCLSCHRRAAAVPLASKPIEFVRLPVSRFDPAARRPR